MTAPTTAERVKALRASLGLTQYQLAMRLGVTPQAVAFWEQGRRQPTGLYRERLDLFERQNAVYDGATTSPETEPKMGSVTRNPRRRRNSRL